MYSRLIAPPEDERATHACRLVADGDEIVNAVHINNFPELQRLLANGASPNAASSNGVWSALSLACRHERPEAVKLLLSSHANPNHASPNGLLPLAVAAQLASGELAHLLLMYGASPDLTCPHLGRTAQEIVQDYGYANVVALIHEATHRKRRDRLRRHAHVVGRCGQIFLELYNEVAYRPGHQGFLLARADFELTAARQETVAQRVVSGSTAQTVSGSPKAKDT